MKSFITAFFIASMMVLGTDTAQAQYNHYGNERHSDYNNNSYNHNQNGYHNNNSYYNNNNDYFDYAANENEVRRILRVIKGLSFDEQKLEVAKLCIDLRPMMADDLLKIAKLFNFDKARLEFLEYAFDTCPDWQRFYNSDNIFSFRSSYDDFRRYIQRNTERRNRYDDNYRNNYRQGQRDTWRK